MKIHAILKSAVNVHKTDKILSKISKKERCLDKAKSSFAKTCIWDTCNNNAKPVHYFEDLNILGLPRWMN